MNVINRIAFLCHPYHRGGVTRWMADAAVYAAGQGVETYFLTVSPKREFHSAPGRATMLSLLQGYEAQVHLITAPAGGEFEFGTQTYRAWVYKKLLARLAPGTALILSDDFAVWEAATDLCQSFPVIGVLHADEETYYNLARKYYDRVSLFVAVSQRVRSNTLSGIPGLDPGSIITIPCGIHLPPVITPSPAQQLKLIFVGRISEFQKRVSDLLRVAQSLHKKGIDFQLSIIGDGPQKNELQQRVANAGLQQMVSFPGWLSQQEVYSRLAGSDILLLTSDFEGTPIAMMEAFASGCGLVATRVSGMEDYEQHPSAGKIMSLFLVGDMEGAVTGIMKIAATPKAERSEWARHLAESEFSMPICMGRYFNAIVNLDERSQTVSTPRLGWRLLWASRLLSWARQAKLKLRK